MKPEEILAQLLGIVIGGALGKVIAPYGRQLGLPPAVTFLAGAVAGEAIALRIVYGK